MDPRTFDALTERLGDATTRRAGLKAALAVLFGAGAASVGDGRGADARKKRCRPKCGAGQTCRKGACVCTSGTTCGANCCRIGQECRDGRCVELPEPGQCSAFGEACGQDTGLGCCDGLTCASGQGGKGDVACWKPAGAACAATAECVYDSQCVNGVCVANEHPNDGGGGAGCGSFSATADAEANGRLLKAAIAAASPGDTILLEGGEYNPARDGVYLLINKNLTLKSCTPSVQVNINCPSETSMCVQVNAAAAAFDGISLTSSGTPVASIGISLYPLSGSAASVDFRNGVISGFNQGVGNPAANHSVTIGPGVTIARCNQGKLNQYVTCEAGATITWTSVTTPCDSASLPVNCNCS